MRIAAILSAAVTLLWTSAAGAVTYTADDLLTVAAHPELAPYAAKVRDVLVATGRACDEVVRLNAFPQGGSAMLVAVHCRAGQRYEAAWDGTNVQVTAVP